MSAMAFQLSATADETDECHLFFFVLLLLLLLGLGAV